MAELICTVQLPFFCPCVQVSKYPPSLYLWLGAEIDTFSRGEAGPFLCHRVKSVVREAPDGPNLGERESMRRKKTLLIVAAMILTIATLAVLSFVRSKMEANDQSAKTASVHVLAPGVRAA